MSEPEPSILWRRLDRAGHEFARLARHGSDWHLGGTALFAHEGQPCRLDYLVICDSVWHTRTGRVTGWVGGRGVEIDLAADAAQRWRLNGTEQPEVAGCVDLDLNFSPSTNLLAIRRLGLGVGREAPVRAAWLRFPSFTLEPLEQVYRRIDAASYHYESDGGRFVAELKTNVAGFVTLYPGFCQAETPEPGS